MVWGGGDLSTRSIVHWECQSPEHRALHSRRGTGGLTIHDGAWAYCDGAGADDAHRWSATGGVPLESLVRWTAPNGNGAEPKLTVKTTETNAKTERKTAGVRRA
jgi:hypothetical protein